MFACLQAQNIITDGSKNLQKKKKKAVPNVSFEGISSLKWNWPAEGTFQFFVLPGMKMKI